MTKYMNMFSIFWIGYFGAILSILLYLLNFSVHDIAMIGLAIIATALMGSWIARLL
ncbi:MAG: hypothetical protein OIF58_09440 [Cohaesibacter sp.]|nr:hypothetical protein [Cohaesibacter sp.]